MKYRPYWQPAFFIFIDKC